MFHLIGRDGYMAKCPGDTCRVCRVAPRRLPRRRLPFETRPAPPPLGVSEMLSETMQAALALLGVLVALALAFSL